MNKVVIIVVGLFLSFHTVSRLTAAEYVYQEFVPSCNEFGFVISDINDNGDIAGRLSRLNINQGFISSNGTCTYILPTGWTGSEVTAINEKGQAVGNGSDGGFLYDGGDYIELIPPEKKSATPTDINDLGTVVGWTRDIGDSTGERDKGFIYSDGTYTFLLPPNWLRAYASDINNSGTVVGWGWDSDQFTKGFIYRNGLYTTLLPPDSSSSEARDINDNGTVVGWVWDISLDSSRAFLYDSGSYTTILPPDWKDSSGLGINNDGVVLGSGRGGAYEYFVYDNGTYSFIRPPGFDYSDVKAINDNGDIIGIAVKSYPTSTMAFIASPVIPEPINSPPSSPRLMYPENNAMNLETVIEFIWEKSLDPDGDNIIYDHYVCKDENLITECITHENIASLDKKYIHYSELGLSILLLGLIFNGGMRFRNSLYPISSMIVLVAWTLISCGIDSGNGNHTGSSNNEVSLTISGLESNTKYYWKITASDNNGNTSDSEIRSFTTK